MLAALDLTCEANTEFRAVLQGDAADPDPARQLDSPDDRDLGAGASTAPARRIPGVAGRRRADLTNRRLALNTSETHPRTARLRDRQRHDIRHTGQMVQNPPNGDILAVVSISRISQAALHHRQAAIARACRNSKPRGRDSGLRCLHPLRRSEPASRDIQRP